MHYLNAAPRHPNTLAWYLDLLGRLREIGVSVDHAYLPDDDAVWEPHTATVFLRVDAPLAAHIRDLTDFLLTVHCPGHLSQFVGKTRKLYSVT